MVTVPGGNQDKETQKIVSKTKGHKKTEIDNYFSINHNMEPEIDVRREREREIRSWSLTGAEDA